MYGVTPARDAILTGMGHIKKSSSASFPIREMILELRVAGCKSWIAPPPLRLQSVPCLSLGSKMVVATTAIRRMVLRRVLSDVSRGLAPPVMVYCFGVEKGHVESIHEEDRPHGLRSVSAVDGEHENLEFQSPGAIMFPSNMAYKSCARSSHRRK